MLNEVGYATGEVSASFGSSLPPQPSIRDAYRRRIPPMLIALGDAKLNKDLPRVQELNEQIEIEGKGLVTQALGTHEGKVLADYYDTAEGYVEGTKPLSSLRGFVHQNYQISADLDTLASDVQGRRVVVFFPHYRQGPEIAGFPGGPGENLRVHDFAPIMAKLFTDEALADSGLTISRFGKPLHQEDDFYYRSAREIGNTPISPGGVEKLAQQFQEVWDQGRIPSICPEAGLRCLKQWRTGGLVAASLAGADGIALMIQSPWISVIDRAVSFGYAGYIPISPEIKDAVSNDESIAHFSTHLRRRMARALVAAHYDPWYTNAVHEAVRGLPEEAA